MFQIKQLDELTDLSLSAFKNIYIDSFPSDERRDVSELTQIAANHSNCTFNLIVYQGVEVGLLVWWEFDQFCYLEHFAIASSHRNCGYGKRALNLWILDQPKPIILEVEPPINDESKRRIRFYEQLGFKYWPTNYTQPPYSVGKQSVTLKLMSFGNLDIEKSFEQIKRVLHKEVYGVTIE